jgi:hypothetical protein
MSISDKLVPKNPPSKTKPVNYLEGEYIYLRPDRTHYSILKKHHASDVEYVTVIPNAGYDREFVHNLVKLLNTESSEAPQS